MPNQSYCVIGLRDSWPNQSYCVIPGPTSPTALFLAQPVLLRDSWPNQSYCVIPGPTSLPLLPTKSRKGLGRNWLCCQSDSLFHCLTVRYLEQTGFSLAQFLFVCLFVCYSSLAKSLRFSQCWVRRLRVHTAVHTSAVLPAVQAAVLRLPRLNSGVCHFMKITVAESNPDTKKKTLAFASTV